jgi:hypothetical protein
MQIRNFGHFKVCASQNPVELKQTGWKVFLKQCPVVVVVMHCWYCCLVETMVVVLRNLLFRRQVVPKIDVIAHFVPPPLYLQPKLHLDWTLSAA